MTFHRPERKLPYERAMVLLQGLGVLVGQALLELTSQVGLSVQARTSSLPPLRQDDTPARA